MNILSFLLGVSVVLILLGVMVIFSMYRKITELGEKLTTTINIQNEEFRLIDDKSDQLHRRIDGEIDRADGISRQIYNDITILNKETERLIDSRLDKLENKLKAKSSKQGINE